MSLLAWSYRAARRLVVLVIGGTVLALGVALLVLPGPAFVVIPAGLAILALEFGWARHWLRRLRESGEQALRWGRGASRDAEPDGGEPRRGARDAEDDERPGAR